MRTVWRKRFYDTSFVLIYDPSNIFPSQVFFGRTDMARTLVLGNWTPGTVFKTKWEGEVCLFVVVVSGGHQYLSTLDGALWLFPYAPSLNSPSSLCEMTKKNLERRGIEIDIEAIKLGGKRE